MSKRTISHIVALVLVLGTFSPLYFMAKGIDWEPVLKPFASDADIAFADRQFALLQSHDFGAIASFLDPALLKELKNSAQLTAMADVIPHEAALSKKMVGVHKFINGPSSTTGISLEYQYPNTWLIFDVTVRDGKIVGIQITPLKDSIEHLSRFTFEDKGIVHYIVFSIAIALMAFDAYVLVLCINTPMRRRKWLWVFFVITGFCTIQFNWMTGGFIGWIAYTEKATNLNFISVQWPVVSIYQMALAPVMIKLSIPLGAIVFLLRRKKLSV